MSTLIKVLVPTVKSYVIGSRFLVTEHNEHFSVLKTSFYSLLHWTRLSISLCNDSQSLTDLIVWKHVFLKECCFRVKVRVDTLTKKKNSKLYSFFFSFLSSPGSFYWKRLNPSPFAPLSSPGWRLGPHFCWDNLLVYPDLPSFRSRYALMK